MCIYIYICSVNKFFHNKVVNSVIKFLYSKVVKILVANEFANEGKIYKRNFTN